LDRHRHALTYHSSAGGADKWIEYQAANEPLVVCRLVELRPDEGIWSRADVAKDAATIANLRWELQNSQQHQRDEIAHYQRRIEELERQLLQHPRPSVDEQREAAETDLKTARSVSDRKYGGGGYIEFHKDFHRVSWSELQARMAELPDGPFFISHELGVEIRSAEGSSYAAPGDWIIRGPSGEFVACTPSPVTPKMASRPHHQVESAEDFGLATPEGAAQWVERIETDDAIDREAAKFTARMLRELARLQSLAAPAGPVTQADVDTLYEAAGHLESMGLFSEAEAVQRIAAKITTARDELEDGQ
jgi:TolA-binding protein